MTDSELNQLFQEAEHRSDSEEDLQVSSPGYTGTTRCKCGTTFDLSLPSLCPGCKEPKKYWSTTGRLYRLSEMTVGHLSSVVKYLAEKMEKYPGKREAFEIALDILYAEIGTREKEVNQLSGIQAALFRSL